MKKYKPPHKPPSRIRYEKAHPTVSFRLDLETKQRLKKVLENQSFATFIEQALGVRESEKKSLDSEHKKAYTQGYKEGYNQAARKFGVYSSCTICGEKMLIIDENLKKHIDSYMRDRGLCHADCKKELQ